MNTFSVDDFDLNTFENESMIAYYQANIFHKAQISSELHH